MNETPRPGGIIGGVAQAQACRESAETIIQRRVSESKGRTDLYLWLKNALYENPISKDGEEQLWSLLIRERPY